MALSGVKIRLLFIVVVAIFIGCDSDDSASGTKAKQPSQPKIKVPKFNADSAFHFVKKQVDFGPRVPNSAGHDSCGDYLVKTLKSYNWEVHEQKGQVLAHDNVVLNFTNIMAQFNPENTNRVLLTAHWDTRPQADEDIENRDQPIIGANDGGSGVAVLLEIARVLSKSDLKLGVDIVFFDVEDWGVPGVADSYCYGSQHWAKDPIIPNYHARFGINLDMVGDAGATFTYEGFSYDYARGILDKVWTAAQNLGYHRYFVFNRTHPVTDDHLYVNRFTGIPTIDIIDRDPESYEFPATWHTHNDDLEHIDKSTLKAVGQTVLHVLFHEK